MRVLSVLVLASACGRLGFSDREAPDGATVDDAAVDAAPCTGPFGPPRRIDEVATPSEEWGGMISDDGLELFFGSNRDGDFDIYTATRASRDDAFGAPQLIAALSTLADEDNAFLGVDGLTLWFDRAGDIVASVRASRASAWQPPQVVTELVTGALDLAPGLSDDELTVYFASDRSSGLGNLDLWIASRATTGEKFGTPSNLGPLNTGGFDCCPHVVDQGRGLMFTTGAFGNGNNVAFVERDPATGALAAPPVEAMLIAGTGEEVDVFETRDGTIRGFSARPVLGTGDFDLYLVERSCP